MIINNKHNDNLISKDRPSRAHRVITCLVLAVFVASIFSPAAIEPSLAAYPGISNKANIRGKLVPVKRGKEKLNLRLEGRQSVGGYDTVQGSCYGKGFIYYLLYNRNVNKCKIIKMRIRDNLVVRISKALPLHHGNDMTFNSRTKKLLVSHAKPQRKKLSVVNPTTLKIEKTLSIVLPKNLPGIDWNRIRSKGGYIGFSSIAYNARHRQYVIQLYTMRDFVFLNENFKPIRYVRPDRKDMQTYQGMDSFGDRIIVCNSFKSGKPDNVLSVYDWNCKYKTRIVLNRGEELESIFHYGSTIYVAYYKAYNARYQWGLKTKKVRNKGIVRTYYKKRSLRNRLNRDGYLYKVTGL